MFDTSVTPKIPTAEVLVANASSKTPARLEFPMKISAHGFVVVGFLRSYEGLARVTVGLDGRYREADDAVTIDGLWHDSTSQLDYAVIPARTLAPNTSFTDAPTCLGRPHHCPDVRVTVMVGLRLLNDRDNAKFKLISLSTC